MPLTLGDIGEREIVRTILPRFCSLVGDDCASLQVSCNNIILTTDPVPEPAAKLLGNDPDPYWMGWLLVTINASDLAAAGAVPVAFLAAVEAPAALSIADFERFLGGIAEACKAEGMVFAGGNLREGSKLTAVGTAIGQSTSQMLGRRGAGVGDIIASVGQGGVFWRDVFRMRKSGRLPEKDSSPLFRPHSQSRAMRAFFEENTIVSAIDNSDGLLPTLSQLAAANSAHINIDLEKLSGPEACQDLGVEPARLWLGWGDWNVIVAVRPDSLEQMLQTAARIGRVAIPIGEVFDGETAVTLTHNGRTQLAPRLESERFAKDSWFRTGIETYLESLLNVPIP